MKCKACLITGLMGIMSLMAGEVELYRSEFEKGKVDGWNGRGKWEIMKLTDAPAGVAWGLKLTNDPSFERNGYGLVLPFKAQGLGDITVDYFMKPGGDANRGLFVQDVRNLQHIGISLEYGKIGYTSGKTFIRTIGKEERWYHMRYKLHLKRRTYDLFVDDMEKPYAAAMPYRHDEAGIPAKLFLYRCEYARAELLLADIKVTQESDVFPSAALASEPFFLGSARFVSSSPVSDGSGASPLWQSVPFLKLTRNDRQPIIEPSQVKFLYDRDHLYILLRGVSQDHSTQVATAKTAEQKPWVDDSYEIFLDPGLTRRDYFQFVANAIGTQYRMHCTPQIHRDTTFPSSWQVKIKDEADSWSMECTIPFVDLGLVPAAGDVWGMNVSRNNPRPKERVVFRPNDMNHRPDQFGYLLFLDDAYEKRPRAELERDVAEVFWHLSALRQRLQDKLQCLRGLSRSDWERYKNEFDHIVAHVDASFLEYYKLYSSLRTLERSMDEAVIAGERMTRLFAPGSAAFKREFSVFAESSMTRIERRSYQGNDRRSVSLDLAGGEFGVFQLAMIPKQGHSLAELTVSVTSLTGQGGAVIPASSVTVYTVEDVRTVLPGKSQRDIPDVLRPGNCLKAKGDDAFLALVEVHLPQGTPPGMYAGTVRVDGGKGRLASLPLSVRVRGFDLPSENTLGTLFSFHPGWAEMFYGKPMPQGKRQGYFDLFLEHRLDPTDLWPSEGTLLTEDEMKYCFSKGMRHVLFSVSHDEQKMRQRVRCQWELLSRNHWEDRGIFFGFDECLHTRGVYQMQKIYTLLKQLAPGARRFCTMEIDPRGEGYLEVWCPFFSNYRRERADEQTRKGREVWWYPTDFPLNPWPSFNLDQDATGPRMMIWITWKNRIPGLLYWGTNREWVTNSGRLFDLSEQEIVSRDISWLKHDSKDRSRRWPEIPWIPVFMGLNPKSSFVSGTNGGANLIYPGPDWQPLPSLRLKNLRAGLQDHAAMTLLTRLLRKLERQGTQQQLCAEIRERLEPLPAMVRSNTQFSRDPAFIENYRSDINQCIENAIKAL